MDVRDLIEEAVILYRTEVDSFLAIITPAAAFGLIMLVVSDMSLTAALVTIPLLFLVYLATYAACVEQAGVLVSGGSRPAGRVWLEVLVRSPQILMAAAPSIAITVIVASCAVVLSHMGFWYLGVAVGLAGAGVGLSWLADHPYDQPLIVVYEAKARDALDTGSQLAAETREWTVRLLAVVFAPVVAGVLISAGLAWTMAPIVGAAIFLLVVAFWLPFAALCLTEACLRLVDRTETARQSLARTAA